MFEGAFKRFMNLHGLKYKIERNGDIVSEADGLPNTSKSSKKSMVQFYPKTDIKAGDWLIDPSGLRLFVQDVKPFYDSKVLGNWDAYYISEATYNAQCSSQSNITYNISDIHGQAVIGNQQNFSLYQGVSVDELLTLINTKPLDDRSLLTEMAAELAKEKDLKKGSFQKFGSVLAKYSDISVFVGKMLLAFAINKNP